MLTSTIPTGFLVWTALIHPVNYMIFLGHFLSFILVIEWIVITHSLLLQYVLAAKISHLEAFSARHEGKGQIETRLMVRFGRSGHSCEYLNSAVQFNALEWVGLLSTVLCCDT